MHKTGSSLCPSKPVQGRFLSPCLKWSLSLWMVPDWQPQKPHFSVHTHQTGSPSLQCEISLRDPWSEPTLGQEHSPVWTKHCFSFANHYFPDESDSWNAVSMNSINFYDMTRVSQELCWNYQFIHRELGMTSLSCLKSFYSKPNLWHIISMWVIPLEHKKHHLPSLF